jgi:hypothetical protein
MIWIQFVWVEVTKINVFSYLLPLIFGKAKRPQYWSRVICPLRLRKVLRVENPARQSWWIGAKYEYRVDAWCPGVYKLLQRGARVGVYPKTPRAPFCGVLMTLNILDRKQMPFIIHKNWGNLVGKFCTTSKWKIIVRGFILFVRTKIAIKMDDCILQFRHSDYICQN